LVSDVQVPWDLTTAAKERRAVKRIMAVSGR
jgi:hypothetical protein